MMQASVLRMAWPLSSLVKRLTFGSLPTALRTQYGFPWSGDDEAAFPALTERVKRLRGLTPDLIARWAVARRVGAR
jgi:uncharacterized protein (DUF2236 family)